MTGHIAMVYSQYTYEILRVYLCDCEYTYVILRVYLCDTFGTRMLYHSGTIFYNVLQ